jgi:general secretion pathway protein J
MTLIEALVALTLMAILAVGLLTSFRTGGRVYQQVVRLDASAWDSVSVQRFLRQALENAYPLRPHAERLTTEYGLEGTDLNLKFLAPMPQSSGSAGHYRYEFVVETADGGSKNLLVRWSPARAAAAASGSGEGHSEVLLKGIDSLEWAYLETLDPATGTPVPPRWQPSWVAKANLPTLVRLRVQFPPGDRRSWPEFVVAPRITDDAGCQFDAISQVCRDDRS